MIVLADNDIIHKLALCGLLPEFLAFLQSPPSEILVLPELRFLLRRKLKNNVAALACFEEFLEKTTEIPAATIATLEIFDNLDSGEQQLLAVFMEQPEPPRLVTGDKRALKLIAVISQNNSLLSDKLQGRVDCLEGVILELINLFGFDYISSKIAPEADGLFRLAFGYGRTQEHAIEALRSYLSDIRQVAPFVVNRQ